MVYENNLSVLRRNYIVVRLRKCMDVLNGFEELTVDEQHSELKLPMMHVELSFNVRYFISKCGVGYCSLLISGVRGKGLKGKIEAAAAKTYIGRTIFVFLSELDNGKRLITVPALFEKEPSFTKDMDLSGYIINTYYHEDFKKTTEEVYKEHLDVLKDNKVSNDHARLCRSILELPEKGIEILKNYK